jgi:hypothetical protein
MNKTLIFTTLILISSVRSFSQQAPLPENDFQVWNETQLVVPLKKSEDKKTDRISLIFYGTLRSGFDKKSLIDERVGVGFEFKANKYFTFTPSYIYRAGQPAEGRKEYESRLRFDAQVEKKFSKFSIKDRARVEHRLRNSRADSTRFRHKFTFTIPVRNKEGKEIFAPFVADEQFYEFQSKHWTRNEFSVGIGKKLSANTSAEFFYLLQNNRGSTFKYINVIGVNLKIKID